MKDPEINPYAIIAMMIRVILFPVAILYLLRGSL